VRIGRAVLFAAVAVGYIVFAPAAVFAVTKTYSGPAPQTALTQAELASLPPQLDQALEQTEEALVRRALEQTGNNVAAAARLLGTNRNRIYRWIKKG
jgi:DNA-binding NtrC family response regulator